MSKFRLHLAPGTRTDIVTKQILLRLLDILVANEQGTRLGKDPECLHDFRVAIRRTRSALTQIKGVFPSRSITRFKTEFTWLGQLTSPSRDLDVYLLNFGKYRESLPPSARNDLDPLRDFLQRHKKSEHVRLVAGLDSSRYHRLLHEWRTFLEKPVPKQSTLPNACRPVHEVASKRIWRTFRRVLDEGLAIRSDTPPEAFHELRKTCKKLRYLLEFFLSLYPEKDIKSLINALKTLQDNLGDFQDLEVQQGKLKQLSLQMVEEGEISPETLSAMDILIENLKRRQHQVRVEFSKRFGKFVRAENCKLFCVLFTIEH